MYSMQYYLWYATVHWLSLSFKFLPSSSIGPTVFRRKIWQIPRRIPCTHRWNSAVHNVHTGEIPQFTMATQVKFHGLIKS